MKSMYIGSGEVNLLLAGLNTKAYSSLLQRFVSDEIPYYNALASPIDALRTGAILESRYLLTLPDGYYEQYKSVCLEMNVLRSSIDFAKLENGKIVDFDELKTCNFDDFLKLQSENIDFIKKHYKNNYRQINFQLLCTGLHEANLVFLVAYNYNDEENEQREIKENEIVKFRIQRDEEIISQIKERAKIFQIIKDYHVK